MNNVEKLSDSFRKVIQEHLLPDEIAKVNEENMFARDGICATHDYCDANIKMHEAFVQAFGREPGDADMKLWGDAWSLAKDRGF